MYLPTRFVRPAATLAVSLLVLGACSGGSDNGGGEQSIATRPPEPTMVEGSATSPAGDEPSSSDVIEDCPIVPKAFVDELIGAEYELLPGVVAGADGALCQFKRTGEDYIALFIMANPDADFSKAGRISYLEQVDINEGLSSSMTDVEGLGDEAFSRVCCDGQDRMSYVVEAFRGPLYVSVAFTTAEPNTGALDLVGEVVRAVLDEY